MKRFSLILVLLLCTITTSSLAAGTVYIDGCAAEVGATVIDNTTYVSLRAVSEILRPGAAISWLEGQASVQSYGLSLTAEPGALWLEANGRDLFIPLGVQVKDGHLLVPVRTLCTALGAEVTWEAETASVHITSGSGSIPPASSFYNSNDLYWLSRIISAESQSEPMAGKIAVGNVVLNRAASGEFPDTIYDVIFDSRWGGQFEPVRNGTIYNAPTQESVIAAKLVLEGADIAGSSLYFLAPSQTGNHWIMENQRYVMTIASHWFYQ